MTGKQGYVVQILHGGGYVKPAWVTLYAVENPLGARNWMEEHKKTSSMTYEYRIHPTRIRYDNRGQVIDLNAKTNWQP